MEKANILIALLFITSYYYEVSEKYVQNESLINSKKEVIASKSQFIVVAKINNLQLSADERTKLTNTLHYSLDKFENAIHGLSDAQFNFKSHHKKWSIAECIEHVTIAELRFPEIVAEEMKKPSNPDFRSNIKIKDEKIRPKMLSRIWKAKSPEVFKPTGRFSNVQVAITTFKMQRLNTLEYIKATNDDLRNHFWKHPLTGTIDLYQTLILMSAHLERHTEQIENIKKSKDFPTL